MARSIGVSVMMRFEGVLFFRQQLHLHTCHLVSRSKFHELINGQTDGRVASLQSSDLASKKQAQSYSAHSHTLLRFLHISLTLYMSEYLVSLNT